MLPHCESVRRAAGASPPIPLWGRTLLKSCRHRLRARFAWPKLSNTSSFNNSSRSLPLKLGAKAILLRLAWGDIVPADARTILPLKHGARHKRCPIVRHDHLRLPVKPDDPVQLGVRHAHLTSRRTRPQSPFATASTLHRQAFFAIDPPKLLMVHLDALTFKLQTDPTVAKPAALLGDNPHFQPNIGDPGRSLYPNSLRIDAYQWLDAALADLMTLHRLDRCSPLVFGRRHGFASRLVPMAALAHPSKSFRTTLSSIASASNRLRREFFCSSAFSRRASFGMASY